MIVIYIEKSQTTGYIPYKTMNNAQPKFSLLLVDNEPQVLSFLKDLFSTQGYHTHTALSGEDALALLGKVRVDAALIDLKMPGIDGLTLLKAIREDYPWIMVIILTGYGAVSDAVEAIKLGAVDFLEKPSSPEALRARVAQLHKIWELREENRKLRAKMEFHFGFDYLVGNSPTMLKLKEMIVQVGPTDATVLIQGETGTGKELVSRAIHHHSPRAGNNFVPVDCASISETVMESELFGHVKGAFTGAHISTLGLIRSANKGTLFMDEVGELTPSIQVRLLRTTQEREVRPVGSSRSYPIDVRILAATNRDLVGEITRGRFREELLYRLNVLTINVPPLRDRKEDIPLLVRHFLKRFSPDYSPVKDISKEALFCLENYNWPGNIRELENMIRRAVALGREDIILPEDLPPNLYSPPGGPSQGTPGSSDDSLIAYEKMCIQNALAKSGNNRKNAAQILGIGEATLYRKIKRYRIRSQPF